MSETRFLLIRHAESTWNAEGRWQGHGDPPLSARGRQQARELARTLVREAFHLVVSSDLARARETAAPLGEAGFLVPRADVRLRELDVGEWTGLTRAQIERGARALLARFEAGDPDARPGGGESRREIRRRVRGAAAEIAAQHPGQRIALVTHLGVIRALAPGTELGHAEWRWLAAREVPDLCAA